jgi:recombinational DNA repair protein (RecF pathway)
MWKGKGMNEAIKRGSGGGWNKGLRMAPLRKCDDCSTSDPAVSFYQKWNKTLCNKHYWHYRHYGKALWGDDRPFKTPEPRRLKHSAIGIEWRKAVFARDDYRCLDCGERGGKIQADHIYPFHYFPRLRFDINNGRTLCVECHKKTPTYGRKVHKSYANS